MAERKARQQNREMQRVGGGGGREEGKEGALWQVSPHLLSDGYVAVARLRRLGPSDAR